QNGHNVKIHAMNEEQKDKLQEGFPGQFAIIEDRDSYDYIYKGEDLRLLQGKNYQKKRNHCSRFEKDNPDYTFNIITQENIEKVKQFEKEWCKRNNCDEARGLFAEQQGIMELLNNYEKLDLIGAFIETEQGIVAFTLAAPINDDMVDVIVEKAFHEINGAYAVINRDFAFHCLGSYKFINREDDMGEENLRKAKLSYFPFEVREKFLAKLIV
ncbi:MAG: phosphatidylglycerol lysyltransferase domain-containing protein, partial [Oscillospiraceae bacterium]